MYEECKSMKHGIGKKKEREKYLAKKLGEKDSKNLSTRDREYSMFKFD